MIRRPFIALLLATFIVAPAAAEQVTIAVASNFRTPAEALVAQFMLDTAHTVRISSASTGKLFAQISNGAPFDILLAADSEFPRRLEESGLAVSGTRQTYATGSLVLWSQDARLANGDCRAALNNLRRMRLAIANPVIAPYGIAARQFLHAEGLWDAIEPRLVYGENIAQTLHFVVSGNAELGLIARSQALDSRLPEASCAWAVPVELHEPIEQQAVVLQRAADNTAARDFAVYLVGDVGRDIITRFGYGVAE